MSFLSANIGPFKINSRQEFFFEPTPGFYGYLAQGTTQVLNEIIQMLARHIGSVTCPEIEEWKGPAHPLIAQDYDWISNDKPPGLIRYSDPHHSKIEVAVTNKHSPLIMGAVLAHELTHHYLFLKGINYSEEFENEYLTDLAVVYLGLGKLALNGYEPITWSTKREDEEIRYTYTVGYLSSQDIAAILHQVCGFRSISPTVAELNLSEKAIHLLRDVHEKAETYRKRKELVGQRQCLNCGNIALFSFSQDDDQIYCQECGWEWSAANKSKKTEQKNIKNLFKKFLTCFFII